MRRFPTSLIAGALLVAGLVASVPPASATPATATGTRLWSCSNTAVHEPVNFVISCADANAALSATKWTSWTAKRAAGTTTFVINLCNPYCAASKPTHVTKSAVVLSGAVATKHGELFSKMVVTYTLSGKKQTFTQNWLGIPAFAK